MSETDFYVENAGTWRLTANAKEVFEMTTKYYVGCDMARAGSDVTVETKYRIQKGKANVVSQRIIRRKPELGKREESLK